jgi:hypothetical protein
MIARASPATRIGVALALLLAVAGARAQVGTGEPQAPWVQVELVLFRTLDGADGGERWPAPRALAYPEPVRVLLEPGSPAHAAALAAREFDAVLAAEEDAALAAQAPAELPFVLLGAADTALAASAARLAASPRHRLLAHLAWRQPLPEPGRPVNVLLTAGERTGAHYELEGWLGLGRARYLHADARLWLNDFSAAGTATGGAGIALPDVPLPALPGAMPEPGGAQGTADTAAGPAIDAPAPVASEPLPSSRTVVLSTSRRLAPGEVHYLDHPLFGALLSVRPWDPAAGAAPSADATPGLPPAGAEETPPP